ncbi:MAG: sulfatase-like hydrolase/transferase [Sedimentisphaerales bacterium]|nr:sulfatase-like hydrolase/transferase [Sedimentisphaerales bacterium]
MTQKGSRRGFLKWAGVGAATWALGGCGDSLNAFGAGKAARKPNIIFVMADDLGYGDLGCYGQKQIKTPNIDRMAAEGMRFTDHYAGSTVCAPSRCCLMTGLHTGHAYIRGNREVKPMGQWPLPAGTATLPRMLQDAGYTTALIGKWGLGGPGSSGTPNQQGFDYFFGYLCQRHAHNYYPEFLFRNDERVPLDNEVAGDRPDGAGVAAKKVQYSYDLMAAEALSFVEQNKAGPFFLYLAITIPHANNEAGGKGMEVPDYGIYAQKDWPEPQKGHAAMISRLDRDMGRLRGKLEDLGIDDNTVVFFTSDNGPHREGGANPDFSDSNGPLRGIKRDLYEGGIRVPLIARWPGRIEAGSETDHISAFWDFLPTFAELAGTKPPAKGDGLSLAPTLLGRPEKQEKHSFLYWEFHARGTNQAARCGRWKAVRFGATRKLELYDLKNDLGETTDVADRHPEVVAKIKDFLAGARTESEFWKFKG